MFYHKICSVTNTNCGPGLLSLCGDSLQAERSGDRFPVGAKFSVLVQAGPGANSASCTMGTGSYWGVKLPGPGFDHQTLSSAEVKERVELHFYPSTRTSRPVMWWTVPLTLLLIQIWVILSKWNVSSVLMEGVFVQHIFMQIFASSWERWVCTNIGHLYVLHRPSLHLTMSKEYPPFVFL